MWWYHNSYIFLWILFHRTIFVLSSPLVFYQDLQAFVSTVCNNFVEQAKRIHSLTGLFTVYVSHDNVWTGPPNFVKLFVLLHHTPLLILKLIPPKIGTQGKMYGEQNFEKSKTPIWGIKLKKSEKEVQFWKS